MPRHREPYLVGYAGVAVTQDKDLRTELELNGGPFVNGRAHDLSFDSSAVFGGKAGYFFERDLLGGNVGAELDVYHFEPDLGKQTVRFTGVFAGVDGDIHTRLQSADIDVTAATLNILYRFRLLSEPQYPRGRLQPYVGVGAGAFIARLATRTSPFDTNKTSGHDVRPGSRPGGRAWFRTRASRSSRSTSNPDRGFEFTFRHRDDLRLSCERNGPRPRRHQQSPLLRRHRLPLVVGAPAPERNTFWTLTPATAGSMLPVMTLTELLVTLSLVGLLAAATVGLLEQGQRAWAAGAARAESQQSARVALTRLVADVRAAGLGGDAFDAIAVATPQRVVLQQDLDRDGAIAATGER